MAPNKTVLSIKEKTEIINEFEKYEIYVREIAKRFNIDKTHAADIKRNKEAIRSKWESGAEDLKFKQYALTRSLIRAPGLCQNAQIMQAARQVTMKVVPAVAPTSEGYEEKNERMGRQLAPHLTIYKPQLTSMLSITHRGTGIALTAYAWGLGLGALMSSNDISHYITMVEGLHMSAATLTALKFVLAFPMGFHTANGVRHLLWDTGRCLKIKEVYSTGYVMLASSIVLTAILAAL